MASSSNDSNNVDPPMQPGAAAAKHASSNGKEAPASRVEPQKNVVAVAENTNANNKRPAASTDTATKQPDATRKSEAGPSSSKRSRTDATVLDIAATLGFKAGERLQVHWEITDDATNTTKPHWWGATLLAHDGRTLSTDTDDEQVAIRTLEYDPHPVGGFPESSREDVVFLTPCLLIDPEAQQELPYRKYRDPLDDDQPDEDEDEAVYYMDRNDIETMVNSLVGQALEKNSAAFQALPADRQAFLAEQIATKREKLTTLLQSHLETITNNNPSAVVTSDAMRGILQQVLQDE